MTNENTDNQRTSKNVVADARKVIPGGAQTGLRAQAYATGTVAFERAEGATLTTVEGRSFTDYHLAFGPIILGHGDDEVDAATRGQLEDGILFGAGTTELEVAVAKQIVDRFTGVDMVNFCNSGSEATYHAIRLSRAHTGNDLVLKFEGGYHGWHDYVGVNVYPPSERVSIPTPESAGTLPAAVEHTLVAPFNDTDYLRKIVETHADDLAAIILEPVPHSIGCLQLTQSFIDTLDSLRDEYDIPLIFDEVITGFRHSLTGMAGELGIDPDLVCLAKAMGNGYPVAAVGGRAPILKQASGDHADGVVISGTYSGHPIGLAAAKATIQKLERDGIPRRIGTLGKRYREGLSDLLDDHGLTGRVAGYGSIFTPQFGLTGKPRRYEDVAEIDQEAFQTYASAMRERGHFFSPNPYKRHHLSNAHNEETLHRYLADADDALAAISNSRT